MLLDRVVPPAEHHETLFTQHRDHVVLGRPVVAGRHDLGATSGEHLEQNGRLGIEMDRHSDPMPGERLAGGELLSGGRKKTHPRANPFEPLVAPFDKFTGHGRSCCQSSSIETSSR